MTVQKRIRLVMLIDSLGLGGAERLLATYLEHFDVTRFDLRACVFNVRDGNPIADDVRQLGIPVDLVPIPKLRSLTGLPRLVRYLREQKADILHTQLQFANALGSIAGRVLDIPTVSTLHIVDEVPRSQRASLRGKFAWWSLRRFCNRIIAVSDAARQHYLASGNVSAAKITTMYNGIDLTHFTGSSDAERREKRAALGVPPDAEVITTVAVLRRAKGIQYQIEALPKILKLVPNAYYLVVGDGQYRHALELAARQHRVADKVIFTGARKDIPELLAMSDVFVLPTLDEALPTVLAEAMAAGKPIVACRVGGVPEMVEDGRNGILVPPAEPDQLANACLRLMQQPDQAQKMGQAGREIVKNKFNIVKQVQKLSDLYLDLLKRSNN